MRFAAAFPSWTPTAVNDAANFTDSGHHSIQGVASTRVEVREVFLSGLAAASAPTHLVLGRDSTVGATLTAGRFAALDGHSNAPASVPTSFQISTTKPQRSSTLGMLLVLAFNAFGGIVRWVNGPDEIIAMFGASASLGEISLSSLNAGTPGLLMSNVIVDVV